MTIERKFSYTFVTNVHITPTVDGYIAEVIELFQSTFLIAEHAGEAQVRVEDLNVAVATVSNEQATRRMDCNTIWVVELEWAVSSLPHRFHMLPLQSEHAELPVLCIKSKEMTAIMGEGKSA